MFPDTESGEPIYFDTETTGLHGPAVLIQWAQGDGPIHLYSVWKEPVIDTLKLIESFAINKGGVIGFNLAFDWFHLCQLYTTLLLLNDHHAYPEDLIEEYALKEPLARDGPCIKPVKACDIMLVARRGPYQSTMERGEIRIKKVPTALAWLLAQELERRVPLSDIYFAKRKDKLAARWKVYDIKDSDEDVIPDFKDVVLTFHPSSALKALAVDALKLKPDAILLFADIELDKKVFPEEMGYAPFALAIGAPGDWNGAWPEFIRHHINHWGYHKLAREYAAKDVDITRRLYQHFGSPELGDDDSELACMVGAVRWKGFQVDVKALAELKKQALARIKSVPTAPAYAKRYVQEHMSDDEILTMKGSTKKVVLEEIAKWVNLPCPICDETGVDENYEPCSNCKGTKVYTHPAAARAQDVLDARKALYEIDFYDKLILAGRLHASFVIIGTLSSRMAGTDQLNAQGIKKDKRVRSCFPLAWPGSVLSGGDFSGFEVVLAEACYNDPDLRKDLMTGKKIHGLFGVFVYPDMTYEEILASDGTANDVYTKAKSAVFAMLYGGEGFTLKERLGVPIEVADEAYRKFCARYPGVGRARQKIIDMFQSLRQPNGIGSAVEWHEPADYIESMFGFRRYFSLENRISRALYELASSPPLSWKNLKGKVIRRDRQQFPVGAVQSALFGATFALQASNMRAAANHVIQSSGAQVTKLVQRKIWDLQSSGIGEWIVQPMNIHDEILTPTHPDYVDKVEEIVNSTVESIRPKVPLIKMGWKKSLSSWAGK